LRAKPKQNSTVVNDTEIAWVEWGEPGCPVVLLSHATGFHSRCWDEVAAHLDGCRVIAADHRGHGRSESKPFADWGQFGADLVALVVALDLREVLGVGHSMGAHCMVQAAASEPDRFRELILIDPVILDPGFYVAGAAVFGEEHPVARRRNDWESPAQMFDALKKREPFSRWDDRVLRDYCEHGLVKTGESYLLACRPEDEAAVYAASLKTNIYDRIPSVNQPVTVIRAEWRGFEEARHDFALSPTWPKLAARFADGRDVYLPEYSHFLPMEDPEYAASLIKGEQPT
jgi:pimeloyl-ACP methyl ester carboxylesterase